MIVDWFARVKVTLIVTGLALLAGLGIGAFGARAFYAPRLDLAESRVKDLSEKIDQQNEAIDAIARADKKRAAEAKAAIAAARRDAEQAQLDAMDIMTRQPAPGVDRCTAASDLIRKELAK